MALFSVAEARAFDKGQLAEFESADITAAEVRINAQFTRICAVAFEPTNVTDEYHDGSGTALLMLDCHNPLREMPARPVTLTGASVDGTALTTDDISTTDYDVGMAVYADRLVRRGDVWEAGSQNVAVSYTHGYLAVPEAIKRAALLVCLSEMLTSDLARAATSYSDGEASYTLYTPGSNRGFEYALPEVNAILGQFREDMPGVA